MAFKIVYTESALADLEAIHDYVLVDNPAAASRFGSTRSATSISWPPFRTSVHPLSGVLGCGRSFILQYGSITESTKGAGVSKYFTSGAQPGRSQIGYNVRGRFGE